MIPNRDLEKVVKLARETVIPVWEHMEKSLIQNGIHWKRTQRVAIWKKWQESSRILDYSRIRIVKTYIVQILSIAKDAKLLGNHSYPHARLLTLLLLRN